MARIRFLYTNLWNAAGVAISANSAVSGLPAVASQNPDRTYVWRAVAGTGEAYLRVDLGSVKAASSVAIANPVLKGGTAAKLQHLGDGATPGVAVDVATLTAPNSQRKTSLAFFAEQSHRHWQILFPNPSAVDASAEAGYVHLGGYYEPPINVRVPMAVTRHDPSQSRFSVDRQRSVTRRSKYCAGVIAFADVSEAMLAELQTQFDAIGTHSTLFMVLDTALDWTVWYCRFGADLEIGFGEMSGRYNPSVAWEEEV